MTARLFRALPALFALAAAPVLPGCLSDASPLTVSAFLATQADPTGGCAPASTGVTRGVLDTAVAQSFIVGLEVQNQLAANGDALRKDTHQVAIHAVKVSYRAVGGGVAPPSETTPVSAIIPSAGNTRFIAPLLTQANGSVLAGQADGTLVAQLTLEGTTTDGTTVTTAPVEFPIDLCAGCIKNTCAETEKPVACGPGQDALTGGVLCTAK